MIAEKAIKDVERAMADAKRRGVHLAEQLDKAALLLTPERQKRIEDGVYQILETILDAERVEQILRAHFGDGKPRTSAETWDAIRAWLEDFVAMQKAKQP